MKFRIVTLGCKVNQFESQGIEQMLLSRGHTRCDDAPDVIIINTCAVTGESGRKSRQTVRHESAANPEALIAVCGCYSQTGGDELDTLHADLLSGSGSRLQFIDDLECVFEEKQKMKTLDDPMKRSAFEVLPAGPCDGRTRAMMKIQDGCSNFCTYCIIPYARGPVRSMSIADIKAQAASLRDEGYREIVVTGIEISSYGKDFKNGTSLIDALEAISEAAPGVRIHLGSLEPRTASEEFCAKLAEIPDICPHFHLSLQSGCDATLKRMNRKYDTEKFYEVVSRLRRYFENCGITTDLITGFPGETVEEFTQTLLFIEKCDFSAMHIFPYSVRPGTPAEKMDGQLNRSVKKARANTAIKSAAAMTEKYLDAQIGRTLNVLFETEQDGVFCGHSENYVEVCAKGHALRGKVKTVLINSRVNDTLIGEITN